MLYLILKGSNYLVRQIANRLNTFVYKKAFAKVGKNVFIFQGFYCTDPKKIYLGSDILIDRFCSFSSEFTDSQLRIGNNVKINSNNFVDYSGGVDIGENTTISSHTKIFSHSHGYDPRSEPQKKPLKIGKNVWIGSGVTICENVDYIGDYSLIAAGSVVTKNVEARQIIGGNPAKFIKEL